MRIIQTTHLKTWAGSKLAEQSFPYLVKSLIVAVVNPDRLRMPSGDAVWIPGFDGVILNGDKNRFVPSGLSVWELGTNGDFRGKAKSDYEKRSQADPQLDEKDKGVKLDRSQVTFVFVTPHVWADKETWVGERKAEGVWKDVVVVDGADLQDWLEEAPAVAIRFCGEIGITPEAGLQTLEQAWEEWSHMTSPPMSDALVTVGREAQEKDLIGRLVAPPSTFSVRGDSPREAWGFVLAAILRATASERLSFAARTVVADNEGVASALRNLGNLVIVLKNTTGQVSGALSSRGCHVIVPEGNDAYSDRNCIVLTRPPYRVFAKALEGMGMREDESERCARACGRSVTILRRQLAHANVELPNWVKMPTATQVLPALLAGRWNSESKADQHVLCLLGGVTDYATIEGRLQEFLTVDEAPLLRVGELWSMTAPVDTFQMMARRLTVQDLQRFKDACSLVFGRIDPKVELPPEQWIYHYSSEETAHSEWLRTGLAETLLLISDRGDDAKLVCIPSPRVFADQVVKAIPGLRNDWRVLASLRDQYPRLVEAAPSPLLESLEHLLEASPKDVARLFSEGDGVFGGGAMHTGLLWGLETLSWSPEYLNRVVLLLGRLAALDPGGRIINRPINSLKEILQWWHPGTNATFSQRVSALNRICEQESAIGWDLLASLLPNTTWSTSTPTAKPRWRDFGELPEDATTRNGQFRYLSAIIDLTLDNVGADPKRWSVVLESLKVVTNHQRERALAQLESLSRSDMPDEVREEFWELLRDFIYKNRTFEDSQWALTGEPLAHLEETLARFTPEDPVQRTRWLFDEWVPDLPTHYEDWHDREKEADELRLEAVKEVLKSQGETGLIRMGVNCQYPGLVAIAVVGVLQGCDAVLKFIKATVHSMGESGLPLGSQVSNQARIRYGDDWRRCFLQEARTGIWTPAFVGTLMMWWPDGPLTWSDAESLGEDVAKEYWLRKPVHGISDRGDDAGVEIGWLLKVGRAGQALRDMSFQSGTVPTEMLVRVFEATIRGLAEATEPDEVRQLGLTSYHFRQFLDQLRTREDLPMELMVRYEYWALPLLGSTYSHGLTLHEAMAQDPGLFVHVICDCFLPAHRDKSKSAPPSQDAVAKAKAAYTLLKSMDRIPGHSTDGGIDGDALLKWVVEARRHAAEQDRSVIADLHIGQVLAHSPVDPQDNAWPHQTVRDVVESIASEDIGRGMRTERFNMRGVYTKALREGGTQERDLASQYRTWADAARTKWPRMAAVLEGIADSWDEEARREDLRAEQEDME